MGTTVTTVLVLVGAVLLYLYIQHDEAVCYGPNTGTICHAENDSPYGYFGTKTEYHTAIGSLVSNNYGPLEVPGCDPVLYYLFNRHTTRYPDREDIITATTELPRILRLILMSADSGTLQLCEEDIKAFREWTFRFEPDHDNHVSASGINTTQQQVRRLKQRFPTLFSTAYSSDDYDVAFTSRIRTKETAMAFMRELLGADAFGRIETELTSVKDHILQFHRECDKILKSRGEKKKPVPEVVAFESGPYYKSMLRTLSQRVGFDVNKDELKQISRACFFEKAIHGESPWCALFTAEEWKIVEYREDLDDFYKDAYGRERNYAQACPLLREVVKYVKQRSEGSGPRMILHFSHAGSFKKIVARFGLAHQAEPLTAADYCKFQGRNWRSSLVSPFNGNVALAMYRCPRNTYKVVTLLNEQVEKLPNCSSVHCPLEEFLSYYEPLASSCDLEHICTPQVVGESKKP